MPPSPLNRILGWLFALEGLIVRRMPLPFGVSYAAVLRRP